MLERTCWKWSAPGMPQWETLWPRWWNWQDWSLREPQESHPWGVRRVSRLSTKKYQDWFNENGKEIQAHIDKQRRASKSWQVGINPKQKQDVYHHIKAKTQQKIHESNNKWWEDKKMWFKSLLTAMRGIGSSAQPRNLWAKHTQDHPSEVQR